MQQHSHKTHHGKNPAPDFYPARKTEGANGSSYLALVLQVVQNPFS